MFGNFLEETATGTGATLALAGVTNAGWPTFSEKFVDGDLVAYVVDDSGGTIKVGGVGTYVSATDDITRSDTWSWNGSTYDDSPATNITLSGGTHTVRCDAISDDLNDGGANSGRIQYPDIFNELTITSSLTSTARILYVPFPLKYTAIYDAFAFEVTTVTDTNVRCGLYSSKNGLPDALIAVHDTSFNITTTGLKSAGFDGGALNLKAGNYFLAFHNDAAITLQGMASDSILCNSLGSVDMTTAVNNARQTRAYAAMPDPAEIGSLTYLSDGITMGLDVA